jgi:uncharacterized FAD-dependent dehydrogenase
VHILKNFSEVTYNRVSMKKKNILAIGCGGAGMFSLVVASQLKKGGGKEAKKCAQKQTL